MKTKPFLMTMTMMLSTPLQADIIEKQFRAAFSKDAAFVMPSSEEMQRFQSLITQALDKKMEASQWQALGFEIKKKPPLVFVLPEKNRTQGFMVLSPDKMKPWLLQAPHAKSDLHTGKLAAKLFAEGPFRLGIWNTLPRKSVDAAHHYQSYWQALTQAFAEKYADGRIIQLHGFAANKRKSREARKAGMIVSAGHDFPPVWVKAAAKCLQDKGFNALLYPYQVSELGATTNSQGQLLQALGHQGFLHLEMSREMRGKLLEEKALRAQLLACLQ